MTTQAQTRAAQYVMNNMYLGYEGLNVSVDEEDGIAAVNILIEAARIEHQLGLEMSPGKVAQSTNGRAHILHALPPQTDPRFIGLTLH